MPDILGKIIDFAFSKDNRKYILVFFVLGFVLASLMALRLDFAADEMLHGPHSIGFIESGKLQIMDQDSVWFFLTDLSAKIFGVSAFGIRFLQVLAAGLMIILVYLVGKELFDEKTALIASFIFTFSSYILTQIRALMDIPMSFFSLLALYFFILFIKKEKKKFFFLTFLSLGIAIMIKQIALWFIPAFLIFLAYHNKKTHKNLKLKQIFIAFIILFIIILPILTFNYLLYKDKKLVDLQFARFTKIGFEKYQDIANTIQPFSVNFLFLGNSPGIIQALSKHRFEPLLTIILALLGLFFFIKEKNKFSLLLALYFLLPFLFLAGTSTLTNHFVYVIPLISLFSALSITKLSLLIKQEKTRKIFVYLILALIIILSFIKINAQSNGFLGKNELDKMIDFKNKNIEDNALVLADSRIYRGRIVFMFYDKHYLETNYFPSLIQNINNLPGPIAPLTTYFIEAVTDDSGWGTVASQPEFNQTTETIVEYFKNNSQLLTTIYGIKGEEHFKVYKANLQFKLSALQSADSTHQWFYYSVSYNPKGSSFDDYTTYNALDTILDKLAHLILYAEVIVAISLILYIFLLLYKTS